jgi:hypothetical protein
VIWILFIDKPFCDSPFGRSAVVAAREAPGANALF